MSDQMPSAVVFRVFLALLMVAMFEVTSQFYFWIGFSDRWVCIYLLLGIAGLSLASSANHQRADWWKRRFEQAQETPRS